MSILLRRRANARNVSFSNSLRRLIYLYQLQVDNQLGIQEEVENVDIIPAIRTDHSAISMHINGIEETERGPSFWNLIPVF